MTVDLQLHIYSSFLEVRVTVCNFSAVSVCPVQVMMRVELLYGAAGLVGSLVSGHLFLLYSSSLGHGIILLIVSLLINLLCFIFSIFLLQVSQYVCMCVTVSCMDNAFALLCLCCMRQTALISVTNYEKICMYQD